jgi:hypothetical protein
MDESLIRATTGRPRRVWLGCGGPLSLRTSPSLSPSALFFIPPQKLLDRFIAAMFLQQHMG